MAIVDAPDLRQRKGGAGAASGDAGELDAAAAGQRGRSRRNPPAAATPAPLALLLVVLALAAGAVAVHRLQLLPQSLCLAPHVRGALEKLQTSSLLRRASGVVGGGAAAAPRRRGSRLFTREELSVYTGGRERGHRQETYVAIMGEVFDVSSKPEFYGPNSGYGHFAGTDGSKSFITGDFAGDVTDDVSSLDAEGCLGLLGWLDFYHRTYPHVGFLVGRFYGEDGGPTPLLADVRERAKEGEAIKAAREREEANWPSCNSKWSESEGGHVWCDGGKYPRKLFVAMEGGRASWRCACFEELGWSDLRKVYAGCDPDAHSCSTDAEEALGEDAEQAAANVRAAFGIQD